MPDGVRENELCPVFTAFTDSHPSPDAAEVAATQWVVWTEFREEVLSGERDVSVWCAQQIGELMQCERGDGQFAPASYADLPPAARRPRPSDRPGSASLSLP